jgi:hypothetical protein
MRRIGEWLIHTLSIVLVGPPHSQTLGRAEIVSQTPRIFSDSIKNSPSMIRSTVQPSDEAVASRGAALARTVMAMALAKPLMKVRRSSSRLAALGVAGVERGSCNLCIDPLFSRIAG